MKFSDVVPEDIKRIGLKEYPEHPYDPDSKLEFLVRINKQWRYEAWLGKKWVKIYTKETE